MKFEQLNIATEREGEDYIVHLKIKFSFEFFHYIMIALHKTALREKKDFDLTRLLVGNLVHNYLEETKEKKVN